MPNYVQNITDSKISIYDHINPEDRNLYIPTFALERIISDYLIGFSLEGLPLRTRSNVVKAKICEALGYPIPRSFIKTDVYKRQVISRLYLLLFFHSLLKYYRCV